ncbi:pyruvate formate lyase activating enzyme [Pseudobutyrivibrio sp. UC1225]|uniref:AmmeMemoRadiSam system radical SAM enzyme n=1 Tax=Pseudobutyrivibrio sp. UC1225 TaxID=1798185 RepID=UPI0008E39037|nr:AmmeMemoRadiSam system radical SAM enzyme [Pseudobutyrivibrio sp. UC1225]SFN96578.1 pyruvate formate lyase activating enzyme [Pseudobutyrivibrio sp. UC1225]
MAECGVCYRHCKISEGGFGFCGVRTCRDGKVVPDNYGMLTSIALDPIEKKPLNRFYPGSRILSVGSYGCNLRCPFCQNYQISWSDEVTYTKREARYVSPEELAEIAEDQKKNGNIGVAFTYNEPLISYEFILDTAKLLKQRELKTVLVSNGMADVDTVGELFEYVDAMNIDLKGFTDSYYEELLKGNRQMVMDFITEAVKHSHVELTTLIIPGENDSDEEILELSQWIASLSEEIPLHLSRFFPRFHMTDRDATPVDKVYHLKSIAEKNLRYVYTGNC